MREVQRLADRICLIWIRLAIPSDEWQALPLDDSSRKEAILEERQIDVSQSDIDARSEKSIATSVHAFSPGPDWFYVGSLGWVGAGHGARTYNTPSKNLEPGDVWVGENEVRWRKSDGEFDRAPIEDVSIDKDMQNVITDVRRKRG